MPKPRAPKLESATARATLAPRSKLYFVRVAPGIALGYRRNAGAGTWSVRVTAAGADWIKKIALADDQEPADGRAVLSFWQAQEAARRLARRQPGDPETQQQRPVTVAEALDRYATDLERRDGDPANACRVRAHLPAALLTRPVAMLTARELLNWRDGLLQSGMRASTLNRTRVGLRAALTFAADRDPSIVNRQTWQQLGTVSNGRPIARHAILDDATVRRLVQTAYRTDADFGLFVEAAAVTGARSSQLLRLVVGDLLFDPPRLLMPRSKKGKAGASKHHERRPIPIPDAFAAVLRQRNAGRPADAPLLARADGSAWPSRHTLCRRMMRAIVKTAGLDPDQVTMYHFRHSSIVRMLLLNVPIRVVAALHDTSVQQIEKNYARYIADHSDALARAAMLHLDVSAPAANVIALATHRGG